MDAFAKNADGYTELEASSLAVGLPEGLMGNSEVGHLNIGAGRVVWQDVVRIDQTIKNGELNKNEVIMKVFNDAKSSNGRLHLCGLISDGGVVSKVFLQIGTLPANIHLSTPSKIIFTRSLSSRKRSESQKYTSTSLVTDEIPIQNLVLDICKASLTK
jgi:bisphosphoglycerate-independent phosphoglycerate mutase (AlkP superfamily)